MNLDHTVVACIPYYQGQHFIRRSVISLLGQTHRNMLIVVVNDGDFESPPWSELADIGDPRLVRYDLPANHGGPFYANSVVLNAIDANYFLVQEQDDWSEPTRVGTLLDDLRLHKADIATSGHLFYTEDNAGSQQCIGRRWHNPTNTRCTICTDHLACKRCYVDCMLTDLFKHRAPHTSLFRTDILKMVGGYYCGFNLHYDTLIMNLVMAVGKLTHTRKALYNRSMRAGSLTSQARAGELSATSKSEYTGMRVLYQEVFRVYQEYLAGKITSAWLIAAIHSFTKARLPSGSMDELQRDAYRLKQYLSPQWIV